MKVRIRSNDGRQGIVHGVGIAPSWSEVEVPESVYTALKRVGYIDVVVAKPTESAE